MLKIYDEFLPTSDFEVIQSLLLSDNIPWYYNDSITGSEGGLDAFHFAHPFFNTTNPFDKRKSILSDFLFPILTKLSPQHLLRVKANLFPRTSSISLSNFHTDMDLQQLSAIFSINSNNGYTLFKDGTKVDSVKNRLCLFDGHLQHAGSTCTNAKCRVNLNINYIPVLFNGVQQLPP